MRKVETSIFFIVFFSLKVQEVVLLDYI